MSPHLKNFSLIVAIVFSLTREGLAQSVAPHIEWTKSFGGFDIDVPSKIIATSDRGYIVAGTSGSNDQDIVGHHGSIDVYDIWLTKLDSNGNLLWQKSLGGSDDDMANSLIQTSDRGYMVVGSSKSKDGDAAGNPALGGQDLWIVRLNDNGNIMWQYTYGGSNNDIANDVVQTHDGGYIIAGYSYSHDGDVADHHDTTNTSDVWILKLNKLGIIQWKKSFGGNGEDVANAIRQTADNGYVVVGNSNSRDGDVSVNHGGQDYWILKLDSTGKIQWDSSYGGSNDDIAHS
ncbi:MAG: hypothetical protein ABI778_00390, partial [Ignavibacteriota bacterium]